MASAAEDGGHAFSSLPHPHPACGTWPLRLPDLVSIAKNRLAKLRGSINGPSKTPPADRTSLLVRTSQPALHCFVSRDSAIVYLSHHRHPSCWVNYHRWSCVSRVQRRGHGHRYQASIIGSPPASQQDLAGLGMLVPQTVCR